MILCHIPSDQDVNRKLFFVVNCFQHIASTFFSENVNVFSHSPKFYFTETLNSLLKKDHYVEWSVHH